MGGAALGFAESGQFQEFFLTTSKTFRSKNQIWLVHHFRTTAFGQCFIFKYDPKTPRDPKTPTTTPTPQYAVSLCAYCESPCWKKLRKPRKPGELTMSKSRNNLNECHSISFRLMLAFKVHSSGVRSTTHSATHSD